MNGPEQIGENRAALRPNSGRRRAPAAAPSLEKAKTRLRPPFDERETPGGSLEHGELTPGKN
jgi:hypothetical protein